MNERNPYEFDKIPEFAMQPARDNIDDTFDPSIYERLLAGLEDMEKQSRRIEGAAEEAMAAETSMAAKPAETAEAAVDGVAAEPSMNLGSEESKSPAASDGEEIRGSERPAAPNQEPSRETESAADSEKEPVREVIHFGSESISNAKSVMNVESDPSAAAAEKQGAEEKREAAEKQGAEGKRKETEKREAAKDQAAAETWNQAAHFESASSGLQPIEPAVAPTHGETQTPEPLADPTHGEIRSAEPFMNLSSEASEPPMNLETKPSKPSTIPASEEIPSVTAPELETAQPVMSPQPADTEIRGEREAAVISAGSDVVTDSLRLIDMTSRGPIHINVEEDILVPDVKPDLAEVLSMDGVLRFSERNGRISGELLLRTLYTPQGKGADQSIVSMESRLPFQQGSVPETAQADGGEAEVVGMKASAVIESLNYSVINERKFRVRADIAVEDREYRSRKLELFQGLRSDDVQMLKETIVVTDVVQSKSEQLELEEDLLLPDAMPEVGKVLRCDVNLVENHKQISREKVVISGTAYCNIMYLPKEATAERDMDGTESEIGEAAFAPAAIRPVLFQGKSEFTQFIPLSGMRSAGEMMREGGSDQGEQPSGGRVFFRKKNASVEPKESESGLCNILHLKLDGETFVELYRDVEQPIVTDAYHHRKEMVFDRSDINLMRLYPGGVAETTVREVITIPEEYGGVEQIAFVSGSLAKVASSIEGSKNIIEGVVATKLVCLGEGEQAVPFSLRRELPFRVTAELPGGMEEAVPDNEAQLKELRFDRLNNRQIELTASVAVNSAVIETKRCPLIRNVGFLETTGPEQERPGLVLYITRSGDTLWNIARRYRTTIDTVARINHIDRSAALKPGTKLLIVK